MIAPNDNAGSIPSVPSRVRTLSLVDVAASQLTLRRLVYYSVLSVGVQLLFYAFWISLGNFPYDPSGFPVGADFSSFVLGGQIVLDGNVSQLYQAEYQLSIQREILPEIKSENYLYYLLPPLVAYLFTPLTLLPYSWAFLSWNVLIVVSLIGAFRLLWPALPRLHSYGVVNILLIILGTSVIADLLYSGQVSALWLLLLVGGLRLFQSGRDVSAGALLGIGVMKPQLFFLLPILLLAQRRYHALGAFVGSASTVALINFLLVDIGVFVDYVGLLGSENYFEWNADLVTWKMTTVIALIRFSTGFATTPGIASLVLTLVVALVGVIAVWKLARPRFPAVSSMPFDVLYALTLFATFAFAPHALTYDTVILIAAGLILVNHLAESRTVKAMLFMSALLAATMFMRVVFFLPAEMPLHLIAAPWYPVCFILLLIGVRAEFSHQRPRVGTNSVS